MTLKHFVFLVLVSVLATAAPCAPKPSQHLAIVVDCSAQDARSFGRSIRAAAQAAARLSAGDTVSVIGFGDFAEVVLPVTDATNKTAVTDALKSLEPEGMKALFAGISMGAEAVRRHSAPGQEKRVVVFTGTGTAALIGPDAQEDIRTLVDFLRKEKISVSVPFGLRGSGAGSSGRPAFNIVRGEGQKSDPEPVPEARSAK